MSLKEFRNVTQIMEGAKTEYHGREFFEDE